MNKTYLNVIKAVLAIFVVSFLLVQVYNSLYNPFSTESATYYSTYDGVSFTGLSIRSENVLSSDTGGIKSFVSPSGQRVAKDSVIAKVYNSSQDAAAAGRISEIDRQISELKGLSDYGNTTTADLNSLETKIFEGYVTLLSNAGNNSFGKVGDLSSKLLTLLNKRQVAIGKSGDFNSLIAALESERASLTTSGVQSSSSITTPDAGYFVSDVDGFENLLVPGDAVSLTPEKLNSLTPDSALVVGAAGKVVSDYEWYIATNVSTENSSKFSEDSSLTLKTDLSTMPELPVTIVKINESDDGKEATVIFKCKYINGELSAVRKQALTAVLKSFSGLRVSAKAIRIVDGKKGVYVVSGSSIKFKTVDILYSNGGYTICSMNQSDTGGLSLYDEVIVKGKNLYDGKIIK